MRRRREREQRERQRIVAGQNAEAGGAFAQDAQICAKSPDASLTATSFRLRARDEGRRRGDVRRSAPGTL